MAAEKGRRSWFDLVVDAALVLWIGGTMWAFYKAHGYANLLTMILGGGG